jgi:DNA-binding response OmpR family regulator
MKLLLIEDEKALATSIQNYFQRENFICEWAADYRTAVEKINIYRYDCVLVDLMLPDGDGLDAVRELKRTFRKLVSSSFPPKIRSTTALPA